MCWSLFKLKVNISKGKHPSIATNFVVLKILAIADYLQRVFSVFEFRVVYLLTTEKRVYHV